MISPSNQDIRLQLQSKIMFIEKQLESLDKYLPETYDYLMSELDRQKRLLAEREIQDYFSNLENNGDNEDD